MAEVVLLELVLDPAKLQAGAKAASDALDGLGKQATDTENKVKRSGSAMSSAFQASGGTIQIAQGIKSTADAFGSLNTQAGLFGASRTILELGKTAQDFRNLASATGAAGGAFSLLTQLWKASPWGFAAAVIGGVAAAMGFFGKETKKATEAVKEQANALDNLLARAQDLNIRRDYGETDPRTTVAGTINTLTAIRSGTDKGLRGEMFRASEGAELFGIDSAQFMALSNAAGVEAHRARNGAADPERYNRLELRSIGETLLQSRRESEGFLKQYGKDIGQLGPVGAGMPGQFSMAGMAAGNMVEQSPEDREKVADEYREKSERAARAVEISLERAAQHAARIGAAIGDAAADIVLAGVSLKQAVANIIQQFARQGLREGFAGIFAGVAKGFGKTGPQQFGDGAGNTPITIVE